MPIGLCRGALAQGREWWPDNRSRPDGRRGKTQRVGDECKGPMSHSRGPIRRADAEYNNRVAIVVGACRLNIHQRGDEPRNVG
jgi:hypothetical protein